MNNNSKNIMLGVLAVGVIAMTVAFAALSTTLRISGTASVPSTTWNIHFQNWTPDTQGTVTVGTNTQQNTASYPSVSQLQQSLSPNVTLVEGVNVTLYQPGDYAKYKFQIINEGSIDAELSSFTPSMTCTSGSGCDEVINYEVKCYEDNTYTESEVTTHSVLQPNEIAYCYLKVEYKDKTNQNSGNASMNQTYTQSALTTSLSASWQWVQRKESQAQGGGNEPQVPSNPYETTFNGTYVYDYPGAETLGNGGSSEWVSSLDPNVTVYMRNDGTKNEVCGIFGSGTAGTVCLAPNASGYYSDFEDVSTITDDITTIAGLEATGLKGYALAKAEEMLNKGADTCNIYTTNINCYDYNNGAGCDVVDGGDVSCGDSNTLWDVYSNGSAGDHPAP